MENDRPGQEEPIGGDLAAVPRRVRPLLHAVRPAPRDSARRARGCARGDLRRARGARACRRLAPRSASQPSRVAAPSRTPQELLAAVRALRARWQQEIAARGVDRERAAALDQRFAAAFARVLAAGPGRVRRQRSRSGRESQADGKPGAADRGARRVRRSPGGAAADAALSPTTQARGDAEGSARREHDRRKSGRGKPPSRRGRRGPSGAGELGAHRPGARRCPPRARAIDFPARAGGLRSGRERREGREGRDRQEGQEGRESRDGESPVPVLSAHPALPACYFIRSSSTSKTSVPCGAPACPL